MDEFDLDRATEVGWAGFLTRLAGHLASTTEPLRITPYGADSGSAPVLRVLPDGDVLRAELRAPSGRTWPEDDRSARMLALGWQEDPDRTAYLLERPRSHAHLLAAVVTDTLREVVGMPHPAFLEAGALTIEAPAEPEGTPEVPRVDLDAAVRVTSPAQLADAVERTLHAAMGHPPRRDADGDVPILFGTTLVYVRTADSQPVVTVFAVVVQEVGDLQAAHREVGILNRQSVFAKWHLVGRQVIASVAIPCLPFVPRHLVGMVELMGKEIDEIDDALALRVRGRRWIDMLPGAEPPAWATAPSLEEGPAATGEHERSADRHGAAGHDSDDEPPDEDLPEELLTLLQLGADDDARPEARLEPALVADVCHRDRNLILRLIRIAQEQTLSWRGSVEDARTAGDVEEARAATDELHGWQSTVRDLRAALRHVVTFGRGEDA